MSRLGLLALILTTLIVLVLIGSMIGGLQTPVGTVVTSDSPATVAEAGRERIRVEVLNAAGVAGLARAGTERIRAAGYDVVYYGNAAAFGRDTSVVLDRSGRPDAARAVAAAMDIPLVLERPDTSLYLDVTVILGRDWSGIPAEPDTVPL